MKIQSGLWLLVATDSWLWVNNNTMPAVTSSKNTCIVGRDHNSRIATRQGSHKHVDIWQLRLRLICCSEEENCSRTKRSTIMNTDPIHSLSLVWLMRFMCYSLLLPLLLLSLLDSQLLERSRCIGPLSRLHTSLPIHLHLLSRISCFKVRSL